MAENISVDASAPVWIRGWRGVALLIATGVAIASGQAPFGFYWLAFPAMCVAIILGLSTASAKQCARRGWLIGFGSSLVTFSWITAPFMVDAANDAWMAPFALLLMAAGIALFWGAAFGIARRLAGSAIIPLALMIALFLIGAEMLRSYVLTGFPWGLSAYIWIDTPVYQLASVVGPHGVGLGTSLLAAGVAVSAQRRRFGAALAFVGVLGLAGIAGVAIKSDLPELTGDRPVLRLVQPNAPQDQKWDPEMIPVFYQRHLALSAPIPEKPVDLIIWPEVAVPFLLRADSPRLGEISNAAGGVPVIFGAQRLNVGAGRNSLAVLKSNGEIGQVYDKQHLVPFGEYMPAAWLFEKLNISAMAAIISGGYAPGTGPRLMDMGELGIVLPMICYEAIFPHELRRVSERPDWMLQITNDAWFGTFSGPYQHFDQARARAIEFALPMVRVANTGISAVIDARGNVVGSMPLGVSGRLDVALPAPLAPSLYWQLGDTPALIALIVLIFGVMTLKTRIPIDPKRSQM